HSDWRALCRLSADLQEEAAMSFRTVVRGLEELWASEWAQGPDVEQVSALDQARQSPAATEIQASVAPQPLSTEQGQRCPPLPVINICGESASLTLFLRQQPVFLPALSLAQRPSRTKRTWRQ